jgi:hypothetical protein
MEKFPLLHRLRQARRRMEPEPPDDAGKMVLAKGSPAKVLKREGEFYHVQTADGRKSRVACRDCRPA